MGFPDEIWATDKEVQFLKKELPYTGAERYIHESRVPVSCGGTMEPLSEAVNELRALNVDFGEEPYRDLVQLRHGGTMEENDVMEECNHYNDIAGCLICGMSKEAQGYDDATSTPAEQKAMEDKWLDNLDKITKMGR